MTDKAEPVADAAETFEPLIDREALAVKIDNWGLGVLTAAEKDMVEEFAIEALRRPAALRSRPSAVVALPTLAEVARIIDPEAFHTSGNAFANAALRVIAHDKALEIEALYASPERDTPREEGAQKLEKLEYGIGAVAFALDWTDLKGISLEEHARNIRNQLVRAKGALEDAATRFNLMGGVGLVNGANPRLGYQEIVDVLKELSLTDDVRVVEPVGERVPKSQGNWVRVTEPCLHQNCEFPACDCEWDPIPSVGEKSI